MPDVLSGRYEIGAPIGTGGFARVHEALDVVLARRVAVKLLDGQVAAADPMGRARFLREARSAARFSHPHAVAVYDAGEHAGQLFLVMELVEGGTLARRIADEAPMPEAEVARIGRQILDALGAAHAAGLVHRDVKPANVLLDRGGDVKLADFGIAKQFDEISDSLTATNVVVGTKAYLAPEQAAGGPITPAADLYALGVVLHEMLTGERPPPGSAGDPTGPDPRRIRRDLSAPIATTVARALSIDPDQRFPTAAAMAASLGRLPDGRRSGAPVAGPVAPTEVIGGRLPATAVIDDPQHDPPPGVTGAERRPAGRRWWPVAPALVLIGAAAVAVAARDTGGGDELADPPAASTAPETAVTAPASVTAATAPPTTVVADAPGVSTTAPSAELLPGFPATDDVEVFIAQLRSDPGVAGRNGKRLAADLRKIFERDDEDGERRAERAAELRADIADWVDDGRLDPAVAGAAIGFLDAIGGQGDGDGDGEDDD